MQGLTPVVVAAASCVDVRIFVGASATELNGPGDHPLQCVQCPPAPRGVALTPTNGAPACTPALLADARAPKVVFNLRGETVEAMDALFREAQPDIAATRAYYAERDRRARAHLAPLTTSAPNPDAYRRRLLQIVRLLAPELGYCEPAPYAMAPSVLRPGGALPPEWVFADRRIDLNKNMFYQTPNVTMRVLPTNEQFAVGINAFEERGGRLNVDALAIALLHEMRHMATPEFGGGEFGRSESVRSADQRLNELHDYVAMFEHPFVRSIDSNVRTRACLDYSFGRTVEYGHFVYLWGSDPTYGYPSDGFSIPVVGPVTLGTFSATPVVLSPPAVAMSAPTAVRTDAMPCAMPTDATRPSYVLPSFATTEPILAGEAERCAVARWAGNDPWMREQMIRSALGGASEAQPWNTLAHWAFGPPVRMQMRCPEVVAPTPSPRATN